MDDTRTEAADRNRQLGLVLDCLDQPRTSREVYELLLRQRWERWADENGISLEQDYDLPPPLVRLLSYGEARKRGEAIGRDQVTYRLKTLERMGAVERMTVPGRR